MARGGRAVVASCALAGVTAALAAVFGKLAGTDWGLFAPGTWGATLAPLSCYVGVLLCNVSMWTLFTDALGDLPSVAATALNTAANFVSSGVFGWLVFGEHLSWRWIMGVALILTGVTVILYGTSPSQQSKGAKEQGDKKKQS